MLFGQIIKLKIHVRKKLKYPGVYIFDVLPQNELLYWAWPKANDITVQPL